MKIITDLSQAFMEEDCALAIGKFDGFHRGHGRLLRDLANEKKKGLKTVVFCLRPTEPDGTLRPSIFTEREQERILSRFSVDVLLSVPLTRELMETEAEDFLRELLIGKLKMKTLVAGENFSFGRGRKGNADFLRDAAKRYGFSYHFFRNLCSGTSKISSTRVRACLSEGNVPAARELLGRYYSVSGTVVHGHHIGTGLGFPTLNVDPGPGKLYPRLGVYAVRVFIRGKYYEGMANLGLRPTVSDENIPLLEVNVFDFNENVYGAETTIFFCKFIRETRKFAGLAELSRQLIIDKAEIRAFFEG